MKESFARSFGELMLIEGGFANHPSDPGGMTNLGVTKRVWENWVGHPVDEAEMRGLTPEKVMPLYKDLYWNKVKADNLPAGIDYCVFDASINSGPAKAVKWLQKSVGTEPDGSIGPATLGAVAGKLPQEVIRNYSDQRLAFMQSLPTWETFGLGWGRRVGEVERTALSMCR